MLVHSLLVYSLLTSAHHVHAWSLARLPHFLSTLNIYISLFYLISNHSPRLSWTRISLLPWPFSSGILWSSTALLPKYFLFLNILLLFFVLCSILSSAFSCPYSPSHTMLSTCPTGDGKGHLPTLKMSKNTFFQVDIKI
jgi:hypothetical protein